MFADQSLRTRLNIGYLGSGISDDEKLELFILAFRISFVELSYCRIGVYQETSGVNRDGSALRQSFDLC